MLNTRGSERKIVNTKLKQMTDHKICLAFENMHDCCHRVQGFCTSKHPQTSLWTVFTHLLLHTGPHSQKLKDHVVPVLHLLLSFSSSCGSKGSTSVIAAQLSQFTRGGGVPLPAFIHQSLPFLHFASVPFYSNFIDFSVVSGKIFVLVNNKKVHYESDGNSEYLSGHTSDWGPLCILSAVTTHYLTLTSTVKTKQFPWLDGQRVGAIKAAVHQVFHEVLLGDTLD